MHVNVKAEKNAFYATADQAINHVFMFGIYAKDWVQSKPFGQSIDEWRKINSAIKSRDFNAFKASKRRGYWVIELAA
jgi:myo-inositol catabolism protein IolC